MEKKKKKNHIFQSERHFNFAFSRKMPLNRDYEVNMD